MVKVSTFFRRYGLPLIILVLGGFLVRLETTFLSGSFENTIVIITRALVMFGFGISLDRGKRKRNESWLKKIFISFFLIFFIFWDLGYVVLPQLKCFFNFLGIEGFVLHCFYVYLGASFFD